MIYQNYEKIFIKNKEAKPVEPVQMKIYQSNTYRKDLSWLHFDSYLRAEERQQGKDQQSCISVFVAYPTIPSGNQLSSIPIIGMKPCYGYIYTMQKFNKS